MSALSKPITQNAYTPIPGMSSDPNSPLNTHGTRSKVTPAAVQTEDGVVNPTTGEMVNTDAIRADSAEAQAQASQQQAAMETQQAQGQMQLEKQKADLELQKQQAQMQQAQQEAEAAQQQAQQAQTQAQQGSQQLADNNQKMTANYFTGLSERLKADEKRVADTARKATQGGMSSMYAMKLAGVTKAAVGSPGPGMRFNNRPLMATPSTPSAPQASGPKVNPNSAWARSHAPGGFFNPTQAQRIGMATAPILKKRQEEAQQIRGRGYRTVNEGGVSAEHYYADPEAAAARRAQGQPVGRADMVAIRLPDGSWGYGGGANPEINKQIATQTTGADQLPTGSGLPVSRTEAFNAPGTRYAQGGQPTSIYGTPQPGNQNAFLKDLADARHAATQQQAQKNRQMFQERRFAPQPAAPATTAQPAVKVPMRPSEKPALPAKAMDMRLKLPGIGNPTLGEMLAIPGPKGPTIPMRPGVPPTGTVTSGGMSRAPRPRFPFTPPAAPPATPSAVAAPQAPLTFATAFQDALKSVDLPKIYADMRKPVDPVTGQPVQTAAPASAARIAKNAPAPGSDEWWQAQLKLPEGQGPSWDWSPEAASRAPQQPQQPQQLGVTPADELNFNDPSVVEQLVAYQKAQHGAVSPTAAQPASSVATGSAGNQLGVRPERRGELERLVAPAPYGADLTGAGDPQSPGSNFQWPGASRWWEEPSAWTDQYGGGAPNLMGKSGAAHSKTATAPPKPPTAPTAPKAPAPAVPSAATPAPNVPAPNARAFEGVEDLPATLGDDMESRRKWLWTRDKLADNFINLRKHNGVGVNYGSMNEAADTVRGRFGDQMAQDVANRIYERTNDWQTQQQNVEQMQNGPKNYWQALLPWKQGPAYAEQATRMGEVMRDAEKIPQQAYWGTPQTAYQRKVTQQGVMRDMESRTRGVNAYLDRWQVPGQGNQNSWGQFGKNLFGAVTDEFGQVIPQYQHVEGESDWSPKNMLWRAGNTLQNVPKHAVRGIGNVVSDLADVGERTTWGGKARALGNAAVDGTVGYWNTMAPYYAATTFAPGVGSLGRLLGASELLNTVHPSGAAYTEPSAERARRLGYSPEDVEEFKAAPGFFDNGGWLANAANGIRNRWNNLNYQVTP